MKWRVARDFRSCSVSSVEPFFQSDLSAPDASFIHVSDARLNHILIRRSGRCASLSEYAEVCGMSVSEVASQLDAFLDAKDLALEFYGEEVFLHTAPRGRPAPVGTRSIEANLWEHLRGRGDIDRAFGLWQTLRALERAGWEVEYRSEALSGAGGTGQREPAELGLIVHGRTIGIVLDPIKFIESVGDGYEQAGESVVALICADGALASTTAMVRRWMRSRRYSPMLKVLLLEAPRYNPTLLSAEDSAITPVSVTRDELGEYFWSSS
jgi:hypothetical protein